RHHNQGVSTQAAITAARANGTPHPVTSLRARLTSTNTDLSLADLRLARQERTFDRPVRQARQRDTRRADEGDRDPGLHTPTLELTGVEPAQGGERENQQRVVDEVERERKSAESAEERIRKERLHMDRHLEQQQDHGRPQGSFDDMPRVPPALGGPEADERYALQQGPECAQYQDQRDIAAAAAHPGRARTPGLDARPVSVVHAG